MDNETRSSWTLFVIHTKSSIGILVFLSVSEKIVIFSAFLCCFRLRARSICSQLKRAVEPRKIFIVTGHYKKKIARSAANQSERTIVVML